MYFSLQISAERTELLLLLGVGTVVATQKNTEVTVRFTIVKW